MASIVVLSRGLNAGLLLRLVLVDGDDEVNDTLRCDGASYSAEQYPELYARIGTVYGGTGPDDFRVPNIPVKEIEA